MGEKSLLTFQTIQEKSKKAEKLFLSINALLRATIVLWLTVCFDSPSSAKGLEVFLCGLSFVHSAVNIHFPAKYYYGMVSLLELFLYLVIYYLNVEFGQMLMPFLLLCMIDVSLCFSKKMSVILNVLIGMLWCPVMALYTQNMFQGALARNDIMKFFAECAVCAVLSVMFTAIKSLLNTAILKHDSEEVINRNLNALNRSMTTEMFSIKSESMKLAKREVTKYIHDNVGYVLTNLIMMLQAADVVNHSDHEKGQVMLTECIQYSQQGLNEIRAFLRGIQSKEKSEINIQKEILALSRLFERCTGVQVSVTFDNWPVTFTPKINTFILSFVKEGLTNAIKHSAPTLISVQCTKKSRFRSEISISNNGNSLQNAVQYGIGLESISYELNQLGGTLTIENSTNTFSIAASIPFVRFD